MYSVLVSSLALATFSLRTVRAAGGPQCSADCHVFADGDPYQATWSPLPFSTTSTAVTVVKIVNTDLGTTRTSTIIDDAVSVPNTNAAGTRTQLVRYTRGSEILTTNIAFPTVFNVFPQTWTWSGVLLTLGSDGKSACVSTSGSTTAISYFSQPTTITMPAGAENDPKGWHFGPGGINNYLPVESIASILSWESVFASCTRSATLPVANDAAISYAATTVTSSEGGTMTPTDESSSSSLPVSNGMAQTTSGGIGSSTRTVVSEGPAGATTIIETVAASRTENGNNRLKAPPGVELLLLMAAIILTMSGF